jgi:hypothetical protein
MAIPEVSLSVTDGALGIAPSSTARIQAFVGVSSAGTVDTVYSFSDPQVLRNTLGTGPLVELAALVLQLCGGPVYCVRVTSNVAGANSAVAAGAGNTGLSVLTLTGTPLDSYVARVAVVTGAANPAAGTAVVKYSLDNGQNYSGDIALPTTGVYPVPGTGISLNFSAATLVAGDTYTFTSTAPGYDTTNLSAALDALLADPRTWFTVNIVGVPGTGTTASVAGTVATKLGAAQTAFRYSYATMQAADDVDATLITAQASITSDRLSIAAGFEYLTSVVNGLAYRRPAAWAQAVQAGLSEPHEDLARVRTGAIPAVQGLIRDEARTPALDAVRYSTLRTHVGKPGHYMTNARLMSGPTSDYQYVQHRRVMDIACTNVRRNGLEYLNDSVVVDSTTGYIAESDARAIDANLTELLRAEVLSPGYVSDATVRVHRDVNILSTGRLVVTVRLVPLGYLKSISVDIGFLNPSLVAAIAA